jgi:hypothetical protein
MEEDHFNMSMRKFLKQVGVQQEIGRGVLTEEGTDLNNVVEGEIELPSQ